MEEKISFWIGFLFLFLNWRMNIFLLEKCMHMCAQTCIQKLRICICMFVNMHVNETVVPLPYWLEGASSVSFLCGVVIYLLSACCDSFHLPGLCFLACALCFSTFINFFSKVKFHHLWKSPMGGLQIHHPRVFAFECSLVFLLCMVW